MLVITPIFIVILKGILSLKQTVLLIKDTLLHNFRAGRKDYIIFQVGKATLLCVSDV